MASPSPMTSSRPTLSSAPRCRHGTSSPHGQWGCPARMPCGTDSPWYRNAIGDECIYVERGKARSRPSSGPFEVGEGDYVIIPRAVTHRWLPKRSRKDPLRLICIEANSHIAPPKRYLEQVRPIPRARAPLRARPATAARFAARRGHRRGPGAGDRGLHQAPGEGPTPAAGHRRHGPHRALPPAGRRRLGRLPLSLRLQCVSTTSRSPVGSISHHRPTRSSGGLELRHLQLRAAQGRLPPARDPGAPLPPNVDSDEVMFYVDGDYEARKGSGIEQGLGVLHPGGTRTARKPGPPRNRSAPSASRSWAVMVDTFKPLPSWVRAAGPVTTVSTMELGPGAESRARGTPVGASIAPVEQEVTESRVTSRLTSRGSPWCGTTWSTSCPM